MQQVWTHPEHSLERTVDTHIKTLRAKLRAVRPDADPIRTHRLLPRAPVLRIPLQIATGYFPMVGLAS